MDPTKTILACDVGNTRIALAAIHGEEVLEARRLGREDFAHLAQNVEELWQGHNCRAIVASSVSSDNLSQLEKALPIGQDTLLVVGRDLPLPIETDLPEPARIGTDRLCSAAMAFHRLGQAAVVASFGTAITIDCVNDDGLFLGGAILPGLRLSADALSRGTALLPKVELHSPDWAYGKNTIDAVIGGIVYGARGALRELTETYATQLGRWPLLICTGGDAELVCKDYDIVQAIVPDLCLLGISLAYARVTPQPPNTP